MYVLTQNINTEIGDELLGTDNTGEEIIICRNI
jgi:hypothetical protein